MYKMYYRYLLSILVTYVRKSTPELEKALLLVRSLRGKFKLHIFTYIFFFEVQAIIT